MTKPEWIQAALGASAFLAIFVSVSYGASRYQEALAGLVAAGGVAGIMAFVVLEALCTVFMVPLDSSILVPLAAHAWGPWQTALMSICGWTAGSAISFTIARRYGLPVARRLAGAARIKRAEAHAPYTHLFWWVVGTQAFVQIDFISYMFGLFTRIRTVEYVLATAVGDVLPAFFFSYVGILPVWYEVAAIVAGLAITATLFWRFTRQSH